MNILLSLAGSLLLTLSLELGFAMLWGVSRRDLPLVALVNVLTNPVVVLCYFLVKSVYPGILPQATLLLEVMAIFTEGWLIGTRSQIRSPWVFAVLANLFSFMIGQIVF